MDRRIQVVISTLENDPAVRFSELAAMVNLSESRLRHLFKKEMGMTPKQYVKEWRMRRAEELLRTTFLAMKEIVIRIGLESAGQFAKDFKSYFGISPTEYRLRNGRRNKSNKKLE